MEFAHISVMLDEVLDGLRPQPGKRYIDCTLGGGGHSAAILAQSAPDGRLLGLDADPDAIAAATRRLADALTAQRATLVQTNFDNLTQTARRHGFSAVDGIVFDLGISSWQVDALQRGFSFNSTTLDMRFNPNSSQPSAADLVNTLDETELADLLWQYGEEPRSRRIASAIIRQRSLAPITSATALAELVARVAGRRHGGTHPATRSFQALRIAVNRELEVLPAALNAAIQLLVPGGRLAVISFHSLEDRLVKQTFRNAVEAGQLALINKHVLTPSEAELARNRRARSAKLRIAERTFEAQKPSTRRATIRWRDGIAKHGVDESHIGGNLGFFSAKLDGIAHQGWHRQE